MSTKIYLTIALVSFILGAQLQSCHTAKNAGTANGDAFSIQVAGKTFDGVNVDLYTDTAQTATRGVIDVQIASEYLYHFATAANITTKIAYELKSQTKLLPAIWATVPYLISDLPKIITAGKSLKNFQAFYIASGGLTADERAQVANHFAAKLNLPFPIAEEISEATIEAALANMKLASVIQNEVKK